MLDALKTAADIAKQYGLGFGGFLIVVTVGFLAWASGRTAGAAMGFIKDLLSTSAALRSQVKRELDETLDRLHETRTQLDEAEQAMIRQRHQLSLAERTIAQMRAAMSTLEQRVVNLESELASARAALNEQAHMRLAAGKKAN